MSRVFDEINARRAGPSRQITVTSPLPPDLMEPPQPGNKGPSIAITSGMAFDKDVPPRCWADCDSSYTLCIQDPVPDGIGLCAEHFRVTV